MRRALVASLMFAAACGGSRAPVGTAATPGEGPAPSRAERDASSRVEAPAAPSRVGKTRAPSLEMTVEPPDTVAGFRLIARQQYPDPSLGFLFRYELAPGMQADVFVYPGPDLAQRCDLGCARSLLTREVDGFPTAMQQQTALRSYRTESRSAITPSSGDRWRIGEHLHGVVHYSDRGHEQHTDYWLVYFAGYRLKVRSTFDSSAEREATLQRFLGQVAGAFAPGAAVRLP